jgi:Lrp/AsnC family leucine-responsive transcriptional regulator
MILDHTDRQILKALQADARLSNVALAERIGLSPSACLRRVRLMEESGLIAGSALLLDPKKAGIAGNAFVQITLDQQERQTLDAFEAAILRVPEVLACYLLAGQSDYLVHVAFRDTEDLERLHAEILTRLPHVVRIQSTLALRTVKRTTALPV